MTGITFEGAIGNRARVLHAVGDNVALPRKFPSQSGRGVGNGRVGSGNVLEFDMGMLRI